MPKLLKANIFSHQHHLDFVWTIFLKLHFLEFSKKFFCFRSNSLEWSFSWESWLLCRGTQILLFSWILLQTFFFFSNCFFCQHQPRGDVRILWAFFFSSFVMHRQNYSLQTRLGFKVDFFVSDCKILRSRRQKTFWSALRIKV